MASKILLAEDDLFLQDGLSELLNREGYALTLAATVKEADEAMARGHFDLAILDIRLPDGRVVSDSQK